MSACDDCWDEAFRRAHISGRLQVECYEALLLVPPAERHWCTRPQASPLPLHRTEAGYPNCATCDGGGCLDCTDPA